MKKLLFILLCLPAFLSAQDKTASGFKITGTVTGLAENAVVTLSDFNMPDDTLARTLVKKGEFVLTGKIKEANLYQINFHSVQKKFLLFMGNEQVSISGDANATQNFSIKGSAIHGDFTEFQNSFNPLVQRLSELNMRISSTPNLNREDSLMVAYSTNFDKIKKTIDEFVVNKKGSPVAPFVVLVTSEIDRDPAALERRYNTFNSTQQGGFYGKLLKEQIDKEKIGAIGSEAIGFVQNDTTGKPVSLASFRGKYVLIDFWASWCGPCRLENPNLVTAYNRFKGKNFTVLGVSLDRSRESWIKAIHDDKLTWTHVSDLKYWGNEVAQKYGVEGIPQNFLVGPDGKIVAKNLRGSELHMRLCELLGCE